MIRLQDNGINGILADEMGLGECTRCLPCVVLAPPTLPMALLQRHVLHHSQ